jgi:hypothetical protein
MKIPDTSSDKIERMTLTDDGVLELLDGTGKVIIDSIM